MMKTFLLSLIAICFSILETSGQEFIPLWHEENSQYNTCVSTKDSMNNEIIYKVRTPGIYVFHPSEFTRNGSAVLIIPGGGYAHQAYRLSGFEIAKWFNTIGVTAFVLKYRLPMAGESAPSNNIPLEDAQRAMKIIRGNHTAYKINKDKIGTWGCSAGGHLAACLSTMNDICGYTGDSIDTIATRPNFTMLISPVISMETHAHKSSRDNLLGKLNNDTLKTMFSCENRVQETTPPAFIVHAADDRTVSCFNSILYFKALKEHHVENSSLHIYPKGGHGINLTNNPDMTGTWTELAIKWLKSIGLLQ
ncbi:MAG: alpha/beta hydrolase [Bacteroidales bacterium]|nr:alpha/beta hydrolase [Bacteroidales bacterium]MCM1147610.1 alpha/beta hydrolase [Bacteroidales bacterium]MCM1206401.1 alpha/beta hydrolase [Bacillota bacterium]MCM1509135.1 alpha/beta hydrolase [Clostridium sp.]